MINIKNLQKTFGKNEVLKGIDLEIEAGEVVVIIGPSGSGKSTFLRCLNLLETPTGGSVEFEGKNLLDKNTNIDQLRQKMGMVFQNFNLFPHKNVLENLTISPVKVKKKPLLKPQNMLFPYWNKLVYQIKKKIIPLNFLVGNNNG